jgi:hypothetical protein
MARLPVLRRRKSKTDQVLETLQKAAKVYTSLKIAQAGPKAARAAAKGYAGVRAARTGGRVAGKVVKVVAVPAAVAGGVVLWRKRAGHDHARDFDRPLGPVATPEAVSPPPPSRDSSLADQPAGAEGPPLGPTPNAESSSTEPPTTGDGEASTS